jgi:hypothetical protein
LHKTRTKSGANPGSLQPFHVLFHRIGRDIKIARNIAVALPDRCGMAQRVGIVEESGDFLGRAGSRQAGKLGLDGVEDADGLAVIDRVQNDRARTTVPERPWTGG